MSNITDTFMAAVDNDKQTVVFDPLERPLWELEPDIVDPYEVLPEIQTWGTVGDRKALPKQGIITFQSKQKKGKSLSTYALALSLLSGQPLDTFTPAEKPNLLMVFDMEMGKCTLVNRIRPIANMLGADKNRFAVCSMKGKSIDECIDTIERMVETYHPDIIVIDQAAKLVTDINSTTESQDSVNRIDKLSINCSVWVVIHENKSETDNNMRGHLGGEYSRAAVESYVINKKNGIFSITYKEGRDTDAEDALDINFTLSQDGRIVSAGADIERQKEEILQDRRRIIEEIFAGAGELRYSELVKRIASRTNVSEKTAKSRVREITGTIIEKKKNESSLGSKLDVRYKLVTR